MVEVIFSYKGIDNVIQCNIHDLMKDIINKFIQKISKNDLYFIYNGENINKELSFIQHANEFDKKRNKMKILVYDNENNIIKENIEISKEFICPDCNDNILLKIKDYRVSYECKNNHKKNSLLLSEYEDTQKADLTKILCSQCDKNKDKVFKKEFYYCCSCDINLCPLCKSIHNKNHNVIKYEDKNYICKKHNDSYAKYCNECKMNICFLCKDEHNNHEIFDLENIMVNKNDFLNQLEDFRNTIDKVKIDIEKMKDILNNVINNIELYYKINNDIMNWYENKNKNYYILKNLNEFKINNFNVIKDLNQIINESNIVNKINYLIDIYNKVNNK